MKINWGTGIAGMYLSFVVMIVVLVSMSAAEKIDLATDKYYEEELHFQDRIDKGERARLLPQPLSWQVTREKLTIAFPDQFAGSVIQGKISLYCPSDKHNDRSFAIQAEKSRQVVALDQVPAGRYKLQIDWQAGGTSYWNEGVITLSKK
ncbi:FixH family protein [Dyadobacter sandarakinus]|uniref:FixH family protein n=1 Tax=Dyadobacter sandarakinus TaxID=2747268 RepID=A0ABX7I7E7_9BACT|nr:FixH family protein [Dyadobacter sandarakinus]QRR00906.1 FixH family protein [Dyadobacter sandarakinus]